ncbi:MAG: 50S ribosomal protein L4 [Verrucomicrobiae bacterium]|nr:50S ribosomal protein L4 [Verrucomicrobiae bacterium]
MATPGNILNKEAAKKASFELIENGRGTQAVHDVVVGYRAARRSGTASTKTKATVNFSGAKPWRQKGTGRARAGYKSSPVWRKGGVVFGPHPRDYSKNISKGVKKLALRKAISARVLDGEVILVPELKISRIKTREFVTLINDLKIEGSALFVNGVLDQSLVKAARNIPGVEVTTADFLNAEQVLKYDRVVFTQDAFNKVSQRVS